MQPTTAPPRSGLSAATVRSIIAAEAVTVRSGLERLSSTGAVEEDLSDYLLGGSVARSNYAVIHGSCALELALPLSWGIAEVRPYMELQSDAGTARFHLGVYRLSEPEVVAERPIFSVRGEDRLTILNTAAGQTYRAAAGTNVVAEVGTILAAEAPTVPVYIEPTDHTLAQDVVIPLDAGTTWLQIVNDLLGRIGHRGLWADWTGAYRSGPYTSPSTSAAEWAYSSTAAQSILGQLRTATSDLFSTPNRWVFVRGAAGTVPDDTETYVVTNQGNGPTSIDARGGLVRSSVHFLETCGCEDSLQRSGDIIVERESRWATSFAVETFANPLHWHFDVLDYTDPSLGPRRKVLSQSWTLPLDGRGMMQHTWKAL